MSTPLIKGAAPKDFSGLPLLIPSPSSKTKQATEVLAAGIKAGRDNTWSSMASESLPAITPLFAVKITSAPPPLVFPPQFSPNHHNAPPPSGFLTDGE